jgi:hypothetical protein
MEKPHSYKASGFGLGADDYGYNQAIANWSGSSWTTSPSPLPSGSEFTISSAASSPSHVWAFGFDDSTGESLILSNS